MTLKLDAILGNCIVGNRIVYYIYLPYGSWFLGENMFKIFTKLDVFDCLHDNTVARNAPASWPAATPQDENVDLYLSSIHEQ